jgi:hypothetical protein
MTSFSVIAPLPETEARESLIHAANDDPLGRVLAAPSECQLAPALVQAVTQNILRSLITGYLHEPPLAHWYRHAYTVNSRALAFHEVLGKILARLQGVAPDECARFARAPRAEQLGEWVAGLYRLCRRVLPPAESPELEAPAPQPVLDCPLPWAVRRLAGEMRGNRGLQLLLHGSLATCDATAYSDVDTLLIVSHDWLESGERVSELRRIVSRAQRWLYRFDPLQHHGFMLVTELDLGRYARWYFPLELLSYAYSLGDVQPIRYRVRASAEDRTWLLRRVCERIERLERGEIPAPATRYALKLVLSEMMLLPTYYLQATGRVMYKRESFAAVRGDFSPEARAAIDALTAWRRDWQRAAWESCYRAFGAWVPDPIGRRMLARARTARVNERDRARWNHLLPGARLLGDELLQRAEATA